MKTKPFDLEEALNGVKVVTRQFVPVYNIGVFEEGNETYSTEGYIDNRFYSWTADGKYIVDEESMFDLFLVDEETSTQQSPAFQQMYQVLRMLQEESGVSLTHQQWKQVNEAVEAAQKEQGYA